LIYRLSHVPARFDDDVRGKVRALAGVTSVAAVPSPAASTPLAFSDPLCAGRGHRRRGHTVPPRGARRPQRHRGGGGRQCSSWTNRPYARWRSPPWLASRLHQGRCMSAPRPNPSLRERVKPPMLHPRVRSVTATTDRQWVMLCGGLAAAAVQARPPIGIPSHKGDNDGNMARIWPQACARHWP
jgi:hypothetical protein